MSDESFEYKQRKYKKSREMADPVADLPGFQLDLVAADCHRRRMTSFLV
jgi:hypothetical protein